MKTIIPSIVGAGIEAQSEAILGKTTAIQTRWSLGSLVAEALALITIPVTIFIDKSKVVVVEDCGVSLTANRPQLYFLRDPGTSKSRPLVIHDQNGDSAVTPAVVTHGLNIISNLSLDPLDQFILSLVAPVAPALSALGAINKIEAYLDALPFAEDDTLFALSQSNESIAMFANQTTPNYDARNTLSEAVVLASFDIVPPSEVVDPAAIGWE